MTYYDEDNPEKIPTGLLSKEKHEELMEMLGGIFVQLSRIYDVLITDSPNQESLDSKHEAGELFASPPTLIEKAWEDNV